MSERSRSDSRLIILSAPSGAGKTSLTRALIRDVDHTVLSVSHTTRAPRPLERDGSDYYFVDSDTFMKMVENNEFLEYAKVFGNYYGTARGPVESLREEGYNVILEIDWQGARTVRENVADSYGIFILPPSFSALRERLTRRGQDSDDVIETRMQKAIDEMRHFKEFDRVIINSDFDTALADLKRLVEGQDAGLDPATIDFDTLVSIDKKVTLVG
ncbi:MAG: guanylate kinase [marine bacterium B5-7]|nr:MAG: guanylate kinase [marine bacterium B5-7]